MLRSKSHLTKGHLTKGTSLHNIQQPVVGDHYERVHVRAQRLDRLRRLVRRSQPDPATPSALCSHVAAPTAAAAEMVVGKRSTRQGMREVFARRRYAAHRRRTGLHLERVLKAWYTTRRERKRGSGGGVHATVAGARGQPRLLRAAAALEGERVGDHANCQVSSVFRHASHHRRSAAARAAAHARSDEDLRAQGFA